MSRTIGSVALLVRDYDEALEFYAMKLGFEILENRTVGNDKRWVRLAPAGSRGTAILLAKASSKDQLERVGDQTGGRVFLFLETDDFHRDYQHLQRRGVVFEEKPRDEPYGTVAVFRDLYGNRWDLIELSE